MKTINRDNTPISTTIVENNIATSGILTKVGDASIREIKRLVFNIEQESGKEFVKMEMGIPGLPAAKVGIEAEKKALDNGCASKYPEIDGLPALKHEAKRFVKNFLDIDVNSENCIPTVGSMQGGFATFMVMGKMDTKKNKTLFIDPGFPVQKQQLRALGQEYKTFDVYNYRGQALRAKLEGYLKEGDINSILYSNPNNPAWICFTDEELEIIGEIANKYDVIVIEDLAYFCMDFRKDYSVPGEAPFQPTVAKYTNNFIHLISSSKAFSYAGQRIGIMVISPELFTKKFPNLINFFPSDQFGRALIYGAIYSLSSGTSHSAQYGLAAILKAVNDGEYKFRDDVLEYGKKAKEMKKIFLQNGFHIVYDKDGDEPIADGFYFTIAYKGFDGVDLLEELLYYGISAIALSITGSEKTEGLRACVSHVNRSQFEELGKRLKKFNENNPI